MNQAEPMRILAIGAHPDDIEYGCAGTLVKYRQQGHQIFLLVVTDGACKADPVVRRTEQEESAHIIGAEEVIFGEFADTELTCSRDLIMFIEKIAREVQPDFGFVPYPDDTHQDHRALAQAAIPASRSLIKRLYPGFSTVKL